MNIHGFICVYIDFLVNSGKDRPLFCRHSNHEVSPADRTYAWHRLAHAAPGVEIPLVSGAARQQRSERPRPPGLIFPAPRAHSSYLFGLFSSRRPWIPAASQTEIEAGPRARLGPVPLPLPRTLPPSPSPTPHLGRPALPWVRVAATSRAKDQPCASAGGRGARTPLAASRRRAWGARCEPAPGEDAGAAETGEEEEEEEESGGLEGPEGGRQGGEAREK
ncbi:PREDICTED: uncharacterized protein LOC104982605 isoform X2 [Bison bison bison]|nr:PREDICTED: uncharacterized protein LOC104982605 isoform X2 [Bison bison bison]XP_010830334.1 PREDICTED: uncharacterized protein LOC104982605 isoform X2 [Bison bison bison]